MNNSISIQAKQLSKVYSLSKDRSATSPKVKALDNVSFAVYQGENIGIIGPNGSGKSTLLKIMAGITQPSEGELIIYGRVASILDIGAGFNMELSGRENVFLNGQILGFSKSEIRPKLDEIIEFSGIEKFIDEPVKTYSNGMYLRLAFSIIAHLDFDVYLFDEVMNVGDAEFSLKSSEVIQKLTNSNKTVVTVSHNLKELEDKSRILYLEQGQLQKHEALSLTISDYIESKLKKSAKEVYTENTSLTGLTSFTSSEDILVKEIKFYQKGTERFQTQKEFLIKVEYDKLHDQDTIDLILNASDYSGSPIFSSAEFIEGEFSQETSAGTYTLQCKIMPNLFYANIYKLSFIFVKNASSAIRAYMQNGKDIIKQTPAEISLALKDVIIFRPSFVKNDSVLDLERFDFKGQLLMGLDWKRSKN